MPDVYRVRTNFGGVSGSPYVSTQFFEAVTAVSQAGADEAAAKVVAFWSAMSAFIFTDVTATLDTIVDVQDEVTGTLENSFSVSGAITQPADTGEILPFATQGLLRLLTGQIRDGNRVNGRIFVPGPTEVRSVAGLPFSTYTTQLETAGANLLGSAIDAVLCVWHRPLRDAQGALIRNGEAIAANDVTAPAQWAILRSRRD